MTSWKNSARIMARKRLKAAGLADRVLIANGEAILRGDLEIAAVSSRRDGEYLPWTALADAFRGSHYRVECVNDCLGILRLIHVSERK